MVTPRGADWSRQPRCLHAAARNLGSGRYASVSIRTSLPPAPCPYARCLCTFPPMHATCSLLCCHCHFPASMKTPNASAKKARAQGCLGEAFGPVRTGDPSCSRHVPCYGYRLCKSHQQQGPSCAVGLWHGLAGKRGTNAVPTHVHDLALSLGRIDALPEHPPSARVRARGLACLLICSVYMKTMRGLSWRLQPVTRATCAGNHEARRGVLPGRHC